jgi:hypothetical protein
MSPSTSLGGPADDLTHDRDRSIDAVPGGVSGDGAETRRRACGLWIRCVPPRSGPQEDESYTR